MSSSACTGPVFDMAFADIVALEDHVRAHRVLRGFSSEATIAPDDFWSSPATFSCRRRWSE